MPVKKDKVPIKGYTKIEFYGLSAYVPEKYTSEITQDHDIMTFMAKTGEKILMIKATNAASVKVVVT
ncbi:MAG: hypothetical protein KKD44_13585 [Proteobacteria bacterium]|nr:hypothetical protein [Pseudomonadota bacterium]